MMTKQERELRLFEAIQIALAKHDAKQMPTTPEIERQVEALYATGHKRLAQVRYAEATRRPVKITRDHVRPEILAMTGAEVAAKLAALRTTHPQLQHAHREGDAVSDHDLRTMLEDAMKLIERKE